MARATSSQRSEVASRFPSAAAGRSRRLWIISSIMPSRPSEPAVLGGEDPGHAVGLELRDLARDDDPAAAAEDLDVAGAVLAQQVDHVLEELDVAALVGRHRDRLGVFLDRRLDDVGHRAVVAEVDDLGAVRLEDAADDVDGGVVAVEERGRGDEADLVLRLVALRLCGQGHRTSRNGAWPMIAGTVGGGPGLDQLTFHSEWFGNVTEACQLSWQTFRRGSGQTMETTKPRRHKGSSLSGASITRALSGKEATASRTADGTQAVSSARPRRGGATVARIVEARLPAGTEWAQPRVLLGVFVPSW